MHAAGSDHDNYALDALFLKKKLRIERFPPAVSGLAAAEAVSQTDHGDHGAWKDSDEECFLFQNSFLFISVIRIGTV